MKTFKAVLLYPDHISATLQINVGNVRGSGGLPDLFRGMGAWRNFTETQQSSHAIFTICNALQCHLIPIAALTQIIENELA